jgi:hypothetical protein
MDAQALHGKAGDSEQKPEETDADKNADGSVVIKTWQQRQAEVGGHQAVSERAECNQQRLGHAAVRVQVRAISEFEPKAARNCQQ